MFAKTEPKMTWTNLKSGVVSNPEIAGLLGGHWKGRDPNSDAEFFNAEEELLATRKDNGIYIRNELLPRLTQVCG